MSTDLHTLSGAYAIDALSPEEAEEFRTHLSACQVCRDEVRELREAAAKMGASEALGPPPALRARVLEAASRQPQQPPRVRSLAERRRRWQPRLRVAAAVAVL
ncbi:MAG: RskA family anti-sigma factor, partial [Nocardioidaceae bacterium]